jgi:hypothetical protein
MLWQIGCRIVALGKRGPRNNLPISISRPLEAVLAIGDDPPAWAGSGSPRPEPARFGATPVLTGAPRDGESTVLGQRCEY